MSSKKSTFINLHDILTRDILEQNISFSVCKLTLCKTEIQGNKTGTKAQTVITGSSLFFINMFFFLVPLLLLETNWNAQADFQIADLDGECSQQKISLQSSFKVFQTTVQSVYLCRNGYISLSEETPPELTKPSDLNDVVSFVIVAPGLLDAFSEGNELISVERHKRNAELKSSTRNCFILPPVNI